MVRAHHLLNELLSIRIYLVQVNFLSSNDRQSHKGDLFNVRVVEVFVRGWESSPLVN